MRKIKKMLALVIAAVMIVGTMSTGAFAATDSDLTADTAVTITNLDAGDTVNLYRVLQWTEGTGWTLTDNFKNTPVKDLQSIKDIIANKTGEAIQLSKEDLETIATAAKGVSPDYTKENAPATCTIDVSLGLYAAFVEPKTAGVVYNPMVVSADFYQADPNTNTIDASTATMGTTTVAKKDNVKVEKTADNIDHNTNDYVQFTVTTTIPAFAKSYVNPTFTVTDTLSTGLKGVVNTSDHKFEVSCGEVAFSGTPSDGFTTFTLTFDSDDIKKLADAQAVTITYWAQVTTDAPLQVNQEKNDVSVKYSNNPKDDSDYDEVYDETRHYTFDIDGKLFGDQSKQTAEVVKVGVDKDGNWIEETKTLSNGTSHSALADAVFGLYPAGTTTFDDDHLYTNKQYPDGCKITTSADGLMEIKGLDAGSYILKEISAPNGYIKDPNEHTVVITPTYTTETYTKTNEKGRTIKYDVKKLDSYTVTIDGTTTSYENTLVGPSITEVTRADGSSAEIKNTKGVELPSTGGMGTTIFYIIGAVLVLGAGILLVTRRRMSAN